MKNITDFEDLLVSKYGQKETESRDQYDSGSLAFQLGLMLKEARQQDKRTTCRKKLELKKAIFQE
tara:strand:- start:10464 stop:10658 length:195 start_codon:yes stop_codon:yes gene_type:complete